MKQKFIEWFTKNNNGCSPAMEDDISFVYEMTQHMFEAYQAGVAEGEAKCAALASLEAEPVAWLLSGGGAKNHVSLDSGNAYADPLREVTPLYTATPAPISVPDAMEMDDDFDSAFEHGKAVGWNACRADMLQGADGTLTNEGTIPVTQFKPVADLYGLTSPTGGETSFTFDAVEARDFIDGGWLCQEYVELERFQEAITNHTEDKLAMVDHSGDSNNMVEHVTTGYKLPAQSKTISLTPDLMLMITIQAIRPGGMSFLKLLAATLRLLRIVGFWCLLSRPIRCARRWVCNGRARDSLIAIRR